MDTTSPETTRGEQMLYSHPSSHLKTRMTPWIRENGVCSYHSFQILSVAHNCKYNKVQTLVPGTASSTHPLSATLSLNTHKHRPSHPASKVSSLALNLTLLLLTSILASCCSSQRKCLHLSFAHQYPQPLAPVVPLPLTSLSWPF